MAGTNSYSIMIKKISEKNNDGVSPVIATILLVAITVIVCGIVAAFAMSFNNQLDEQTGEIIVIKFIDIEKIGLKTESNITVQNLGREYLVNSDYKPLFYINDNPRTTAANELNARGTGLQGIGGGISGPGPNAYEWEPGAIGYFHLNKDTIKKDDEVRVDIIRKSDGKLISRSVRTAT